MKLINDINERITYLEEKVQHLKKEIAKAPKGVINISGSSKKIQYYYKTDASNPIRKYIKKKDIYLVKCLCQKDYNQKTLLAAQRESEYLQQLLCNYPTETLETIYDTIHINRKEFIQPIVLPDHEFVANWEQVEYEKKGFKVDAPEYYTDKGERVRSKSEILIANALNKHHIPYRYEAPLHLNGYGTIHPDFTVLNVRTRKEFYWEHMGMTDDSDYLEDAFYRISMYEKNNIFPGEKLILSHESLRHPLNSKNLEKMILEYLT